MDWPTVTVGSVAIISGVASFTKIVVSKKINKNPGYLRTIAECDKNMIPVKEDLREIKKSIGKVEVHLGEIEGWLKRNGRT